MRRAYHISGRHNRESIFRDGLRLCEPVNDAQRSGAAPCHLWIFLAIQDARRFLGAGWGGAAGQNDLWEVDIEGYEVLPDPHPAFPDYRTNAVVTTPVPPDRVCLFYLQPSALQDAVR